MTEFDQIFTKREMRGLAGQVIRGANLPSVDFGGADLSGCTFEETVLSRCTFAGADLRGAAFIACDLRNAIFTGATFGGTVFERSQIGDAVGLPPRAPAPPGLAGEAATDVRENWRERR